MTFKLSPHPILIAHRGFSGAYPENTLVAIEQAIRLGVDMVELDVRLSQDGYPVLIHDKTLNQTSNGIGKVRDHALADLQTLDAGIWKGPEFAHEKIPRLEEALDLVRGRVAVNLDLKMIKAAPAVLNAIWDNHMKDQVVISGWKLKGVREIRALDPDITVLHNLDRRFKPLAKIGARALFRNGYLRRVLASGAAGMNMDHQYIENRIVELAHAKGLTVWAWTVDEEERMRQLVSIGVDAITTNWPDKMLSVLNKSVVHTGEADAG